MKKLSIFLVLVIAISACLPLVIGASDVNTISKAEAQELVINAYRLSIGARAYISKNPILDDTQEAITVNLDKCSLPSFGYFKVIEENLPGGSYENMCTYARSVYTEEVAPYAYKYSPLYKFSYDGSAPNSVKQTISLKNRDFIIDGIGNHYPLFYTDENGMLLASIYYTQVPFSFSLLSAEADDKLVDDSDTYGVKLEITDGNSLSATAMISFIWNFSDNIPPFDIQTVECKFVKTSEGWRIDESEYSVLCATSSKDTLAAYRSAVSPSTGDTAGERVAVIGAVSLACIIPTACLMRRIRRSSAE